MNLLNKITIGVMPVIPKPIVGKVASRYIAGSKLTDAVKQVKSLNSSNAVATIDLLGEFSDNPDHARAAARTYIEVLDTIKREQLDANVSLKPTHIGLKTGYEFCKELVTSIVEHAHKLGNFVRIDMEDHTCTDDTLRLYTEIYEKFNNVGIVLQAYLYRTIRDIQPLMEMKANIRICKGIYVEPRQVAYKDRINIINNFALILRELLKARCYVGIATHCEEVIWYARRIIYELDLKPDEYEFQMLLGVEKELCKILINEGHKMRVYVPFGEEWYAYSTRRLKENPSVAGYIVRDFLRL
ncbi:MAG: proline dehydrogenase family protein [Calditrichaeota bacterium]|nr:proline dehydrogenase family protein [Calditrichota bacterium]